VNAIGWVVLVVVVIVVIGLVAILLNRRTSKAALRERFGPEYEREVQERGSESDAVAHLRDVATRRDELEIRQLTPEESARFSARWDQVQAQFVDSPGRALEQADRLVTDTMRERGYPVDDFDERAELVAADHPEVVSHYRAAHAARQEHHGDQESATEEFRQAFVHYRALFEELVDTGAQADGVDAPAAPDATAGAHAGPAQSGNPVRTSARSGNPPDQVAVPDKDGGTGRGTRSS
jgi:AcrR family transcriptional regulator